MVFVCARARCKAIYSVYWHVWAWLTVQDIVEAKEFLAKKGVDVGSEWGQSQRLTFMTILKDHHSVPWNRFTMFSTLTNTDLVSWHATIMLLRSWCSWSFNKCFVVLGTFAWIFHQWTCLYQLGHAVSPYELLALASPFDDSIFEILCRTAIVSFCWRDHDSPKTNKSKKTSV